MFSNTNGIIFSKLYFRDDNNVNLPNRTDRNRNACVFTTADVCFFLKNIRNSQVYNTKPKVLEKGTYLILIYRISTLRSIYPYLVYKS